MGFFVCIFLIPRKVFERKVQFILGKLLDFIVHKSLLLTFIILQSIPFSQSIINEKKLELINGKWFKKNSQNPFSGIVTDSNTYTQKKTLQYQMVNGEKNGNYREWSTEDF